MMHVRKHRVFALLALGLLAVVTAGLYKAWGQSEVNLSGIQVDAITKTSMRVGFRTTQAGLYRIIYGVDERYGYYTSPSAVQSAGVILITGLTPDRDVHFRICYEPQPGGTQLRCAPNQTARTARAGAEPVETAVEPRTFDTAMPEINGESFTVDNQCSDLQTQLERASRADGNLNHQVLIPPGSICYGNFEFLPKRGPNANGPGVVVIRSAAANADLPPEGMRVSPMWERSMARIATNAIPSNSGNELPRECSPEEFYWLRPFAAENKFHVCTAPNTWNPMDTLSTYRAGEVLPGGCEAGQFFLKQGTEAGPQFSLHRCLRDNFWIPVTPRGDGGSALSNPYEQVVRGYRFLGLIFEPAEPTGTSYSNLLNIGNYAVAHENVIVDRCIFRVPPAASVVRGLDMNGSRVAVINSWFDMRVAPGVHPYNPSAGAQVINITGGAGPFRIYNNYIRGAGILLFLNDNDPRVPRDDIDVRRNTFSYNDVFRCGSPTADGPCRDVRGPIELKRGRRVMFEGNIIENFWSTLTGGQAFIITPRAAGSNGPDANNYQVADLTIRYNIVRNGSGFAQITGQDDVGFRNTKLTQRVTIVHNVITGIDGFKWAEKNYGPTRGQILAIANGAEDIIFRHNTVIDNRGTGPAFLHGSYAAFSGLDFRDNILWVNRTQAGGGVGIRWSEPSILPNGVPINRANEQTVLNSMALRIPNTSYEFSNNIIVAGPETRMTELQRNYPNAAANYFVQQRTEGEDVLGFENAAAANWRINASSPFKSASADGTDPGADIDEVDKRTGQIRAQWVGEVASTSVSVVLYPPDNFPCLLELAETQAFENPLRTRDTSTGDRHVITVDGLKPDTRYFYRLLCASSVAQGEFSTFAAAQ